MCSKIKKIIALTLLFCFLGSFLAIQTASAASNDDQFKDQLKNLVFNDKILRYNQLQTLLGTMGYQKSITEIKNALSAICDEDPDRIFTDTGGFVTVSGMLNKSINELSFVGPHNATNNDEDAARYFKTETRNQWSSLYKTLEMGSRILDIDLGRATKFGNPSHYHSFVLYGSTNADRSISTIKSFLENYPNDIIVVKFSEFFDHFNKASAGERKSQMDWYLQKMKDYGLLDDIYNYKQTDVANLDNVTTEINTPKLMNMIGTNKRILLYVKNVNEDSLRYVSAVNGDEYSASPELMASWASDDWINQPEDMILLEYFPESMSAGDPVKSRINNDGYRLYDIMKRIEDKFNGKRVVNFLTLDFMLKNRQKGGITSLSPTDAVNRLNLTRFTSSWEQYRDKEFYWSDGPAGDIGDITKEMGTTTAYKNGSQIDNASLLTDNSYFNTLNADNYANLTIESNLNETRDIRYYSVFFTGQGLREIPYTIQGRRNGNWVTLKQDLFRYEIGQSWYVADLKNAGSNIDAIKITFGNSATLNMRVAQIAVYDTTVNSIRAPKAGSQYRIFNANSKLLMSTFNNQSGDGTDVLQYFGWIQEEGQSWTLVPQSDGSYYIVNGLGKALETNGDAVFTSTKRNNDNKQKWRLIDNGYTNNGLYNNYEIRNVHYNTNLYVLRGSTAWGETIRSYAPASFFDQRWFFVEIPEYNRIK